MQVFLHREKCPTVQQHTKVSMRKQTRFPDGNSAANVNRRKSDYSIDKRERSLLPLAIGLTVFWFAVLCIATWFAR